MPQSTSVIFPFRSPAGGTQPTMQACRAWRIVAIPVSDVGADKAVVVDNKITSAPSGCQDGLYPVWVRLTNPGSDSPVSSLMYVNGDGWQAAQTGNKWTIEYVGSTNTDPNTQQYAYVVETADTLDDAGQVNTPGSSSVTDAIVQVQAAGTGSLVPTSIPSFTGGGQFVTFSKPAGKGGRGIVGVTLSYSLDYTVSGSLGNLDLWLSWANLVGGGFYRNRSLSQQTPGVPGGATVLYRFAMVSRDPTAGTGTVPNDAFGSRICSDVPDQISIRFWTSPGPANFTVPPNVYARWLLGMG